MVLLFALFFLKLCHSPGFIHLFSHFTALCLKLLPNYVVDSPILPDRIKFLLAKAGVTHLFVFPSLYIFFLKISF